MSSETGLEKKNFYLFMIKKLLKAITSYLTVQKQLKERIRNVSQSSLDVSSFILLLFFSSSARLSCHELKHLWQSFCSVFLKVNQKLSQIHTLIICIGLRKYLLIYSKSYKCVICATTLARKHYKIW